MLHLVDRALPHFRSRQIKQLVDAGDVRNSPNKQREL
jgi:hypothetical protein